MPLRQKLSSRKRRWRRFASTAARPYPLMFTEADVVLVNKTDVMPYFDFDEAAFVKAVNGLNPSGKIFPVSAKTGEGLDAWFAWFEDAIAGKAGVA